MGTITVTTNGGSQVVDKQGYVIEIEDLNKAPIAPKPLDENEIKEVFGSALSAQPDPHNRFLQFSLENPKRRWGCGPVCRTQHERDRPR